MTWLGFLRRKYGKITNIRWHAIKLLEMDSEIMKKYPLDEKVITDSYEEDIINQKYDFIEEIMEEVMVNRSVKLASTDRIDKFLTNKYLGLPIFLIIMGLVFFLTFTIVYDREYSRSLRLADGARAISRI